MTTPSVLYVIGVIGVYIGMQNYESRCTLRHWLLAAFTWPIGLFVFLGELFCEQLDAAIERSEDGMEKQGDVRNE